MALEASTGLRFVRLGDKRLVNSALGQAERDVHHRAAGRLRVAVVETVPTGRSRRRASSAFRWFRWYILSSPPTSFSSQSVTSLTMYMPMHGGVFRQRLALGHHAVAEHRRQIVAAAAQEILADNHHGHARRTGVLLGTSVEDAVLLDRHAAVEKVGRGVAQKRHVADLGLGLELDALDRLVRREVDVGGVAG